MQTFLLFLSIAVVILSVLAIVENRKLIGYRLFRLKCIIAWHILMVKIWWISFRFFLRKMLAWTRKVKKEGMAEVKDEYPLFI